MLYCLFGYDGRAVAMMVMMMITTTIFLVIPALEVYCSMYSIESEYVSALNVLLDRIW